MLVGGMPARQAATMVGPDAAIALAPAETSFVSRGGLKLDGALDALGVAVEGRDWLDVGASTGGFTDCLLQRGARSVIALDVGYGQLDWRLRTDPRVTVLERTNVRTLSSDALPVEPQGIVADVSFISLTLVLEPVAAVAHADADWVVMVKPQFEAGREAVGKGGVVRDPAVWRAALEKVALKGFDLGLGLVGASVSPLVGPAGNHEFFLHLRRGAPQDGAPISLAVNEAAVNEADASRDDGGP